MTEIAWMLGVGRKGGEAKMPEFGGLRDRTAVGLMDIGSAMRWNKLEESHFGSHFNKRGTDSWTVSTDCVRKRVLRKHITGTSDGAAQSGETFIVCKEWS